MQFEGYTLKISFYEMSIRFRLLTCFGSFFFLWLVRSNVSLVDILRQVL